MSGLVHLLVEGAQDVSFFGKLITVCFGARRVEFVDELDSSTAMWMASLKGPLLQAARETIRRPSIPIPVFYRLTSGTTASVCHAGGIDEIGRTLQRDLEAFHRNSVNLVAVGVVFDTDDGRAPERYKKIKARLESANLPVPAQIGGVISGRPRVGVFALPEPDRQGALEDVLLALGGAVYADLAASANSYVESWHAKVASDATTEWAELKKPSGLKKAAVSAMSAVLKPGRAAQVSIEDHRWVCAQTKDHAALAPCLRFMAALLGEAVA